MINNIDELNHLLFQFANELDDLYEKTEGADPDANELTNLLVKYHIPVIEYVTENQRQLYLILNDWSKGLLNEDIAEGLVEIFTREDNSECFKYLWGIGLGEVETEFFARKLHKIEGYNMEYLPPSLQGYYPMDSEDMKIS
ncbi:hypothetical protein CVU76_01410 [Candidatus Dojkabacteria bacterium HGW-Dojkabacteria-1]|uniref:Uncharacterized protein n=1 Tax=Candidatus Dojkabacteria bacterium HGW-Dojkabacteria-1 TaxID=2013761 RepID=A0A2N2F3B9_9BACT|nr:MAG: hypothetical protein CVU76_01410 [Candidatus Dojkabacteria bacterium HGW-Dojkabacteria-1]